MNKGLARIHRGLSVMLSAVPVKGHLEHHEAGCRSESLILMRQVGAESSLSVEAIHRENTFHLSEYEIYIKEYSPPVFVDDMPDDDDGHSIKGYAYLSAEKLWGWLARFVALPDQSFSSLNLMATQADPEIGNDVPSRLRKDALCTEGQSRYAACVEALKQVGEQIEIEA